MNLGTESAYFTLRVFDCSGKLIYADSNMLSEGDSTFYSLGSEIGPGSYRWGIVVVETDDDNFLALGVEYYADGKLVSVDNIIEPIPVGSKSRDYWYCIYYANVGVADTGLVVMNPEWDPTSVKVYVHKENGDLVYQERKTLDGHEAYFLDLEELAGQGSYFWGAVDVWTDDPIVLACEYYHRRGSKLEIDNVVDWYAWQD